MNDSDDVAVQVYHKLGNQFLKLLHHRQMSLLDSKFDDPLIDLEP